MELIPEARYREIMEHTVIPALQAVKTEGTFHSFDGVPIRWYAYASPNPERTVVILHGFTESAQKYMEMIWYFTRAGANVYVLDQRGHGNSFRHVEDCTLVYVKRFSDYVKDLECFVNEVVPKDLPMCLYAHSMGGAVAALYLEQHPDVFPRAVLSSPMIAPDRNGYPLFAGKLICRLFIAAGMAKKRIFLSSEYPGEERFEDSCSTSEPRFAFYESYRRVTPTHQSYSATYRWTLESMKVTSAILKKGAPESVSAKVLLCSAEMEQVVLNDAQNQFAARLPFCEHRTYYAKHEIFNSTDDVMQTYVTDVLNFSGK